MVSEVDDEWVHALMTHDGDPRWVHDDDGDLHDSCDGRFRLDERYVPDERNGVGICGGMSRCRWRGGVRRDLSVCEVDRRLDGVRGVDVVEGRA